MRVSRLISFDIDEIKLETILFQAGYLTIDKLIEKPMGGIEYALTVPNLEVQLSLNNYLTKQTNKSIFQDSLYEILCSGKIDKLKESLTSLFAAIPYNHYTKNEMQKYEGYYTSVMYVYLASLGFEIIGEDVTNLGRIDLTVFVGINFDESIKNVSVVEWEQIK